ADMRSGRQASTCGFRQSSKPSTRQCSSSITSSTGRPSAGISSAASPSNPFLNSNMSKNSDEAPKAEDWCYGIETFKNLFLLTAKEVTSGEVKVFQCGFGKNEVGEMAAF